MTRLHTEYFDRRSDAVSLLCVTGHIALVFWPLYAAAYFGPAWWWVLAWLFFGFGMNGLLNLMHETAHALVFRSKQPSEWLGRWVLAPLVFADFDGYKERHWQHHRCLGVEGETKDTYLIDIRGAKLITYLLRCVTGAESAKKFLGQSKGDPEIAIVTRRPQARGNWMVRVLIVQAIFSASLFLTALAGHQTFLRALVISVAAYGLLYLYGLMSLTIFAAALRSVAEHQLHAEAEADVQGYAALRNFKCNAITRFLMGAYGFGEHETHHMHPGVPYYKLPDATSILAAEQASLTPRRGYFATLLTIVRSATPHHSHPVSPRQAAPSESAKPLSELTGTPA
jgi:fatty acid desaturase